MIDHNIPKPIVHVRSLGEFEYCPRAGIIAFENQIGKEIDEDSIRVPNLGYSPILNLGELQKAIAEKWGRVGKSLFLGLAMAAFAYVIGRMIGYPQAAFPWLISVLPFLVAYVAAKDLVELYVVYIDARKAGPMQMLHESTRIPVEVDWWELVKAYQSTWVVQPYSDPITNLVGKSHRILTFHNHRIPVILSYSRSEKIGVRATHKIKMAIYCYLILLKERRSSNGLEPTGSAKSDWGIVIFADTRKGYAVPINPLDIGEALQKLDKFHQAIAAISEGKIPSKPNPEACQLCPNNIRRVYEKGATETMVAGRAILPFTDPQDKTHCDCGDRFQWSPPIRFEEE